MGACFPSVHCPNVTALLLKVLFLWIQQNGAPMCPFSTPPSVLKRRTSGS